METKTTQENVKVIRVFGRKIDLGDKSFVTYSMKVREGKFIKVKFTKDCERVPKKAGYLLLTINASTCSVQKGRKIDDERRDFDTLWVNEVIDAVKDEKYEAEQKEKAKKRVDAIFNGDDTNDDPIF